MQGTSKLLIRILLCSTFMAGSVALLQGCVFTPEGKQLFSPRPAVAANQSTPRKRPQATNVAAANGGTFGRAGNDSSGGNSSGSSSSSSSSSGSSSSGSSGGSDSGGSDSGGGDTGGGDTGWGSDRRLKTDIRRLGTSPAGIPVYAFRYIWGGPLFIGTMAQDLLLIRPDAAIQTTSGYYMVNYEKLDIDMISVAEGISLATAGAGATAVALAVDAASKRQRKPPAVFSSQRAVQPAI
ncbi:tail fiber domain-containing protein [Rhizobium laguerreae]|uniref:tail fiber domain-containing protein n=3 Tax=Rhizobium leguminosarum TaxID=384 RepID=UPI001C9800F4|nr:tail fiber domain-containing protein [Rhizobium leguminosarum]MBY5770219.1 tail fiber domain-containing protein [Rhizobium leguminosarum]